jgi:hypothetical protein
MYSNIPISDTRKILEDTTRNKLVDPYIRQELLSWFDTITTQNYFLQNNNIVFEKEAPAMGPPSSSIVSELFLQHAENSHLPMLAQKQYLLKYFRYIDEILLIFDPSHTVLNPSCSILTPLNSNIIGRIEKRQHPQFSKQPSIKRPQTSKFPSLEKPPTPTHSSLTRPTNPTTQLLRLQVPSQ